MDTERLRELATYAEEHGGRVKAEMLREYADKIEAYEPVADAVAAEQRRGEYDRERIEEQIYAEE